MKRERFIFKEKAMICTAIFQHNLMMIHVVFIKYSLHNKYTEVCNYVTKCENIWC